MFGLNSAVGGQHRKHVIRVPNSGSDMVWRDLVLSSLAWPGLIWSGLVRLA